MVEVPDQFDEKVTIPVLEFIELPPKPEVVLSNEYVIPVLLFAVADRLTVCEVNPWHRVEELPAANTGLVIGKFVVTVWVALFELPHPDAVAVITDDPDQAAS